MVVTILKGILVVALAVPLSLLALLGAFVQPSARLYHWSARSWSRMVLWLFGIKVKIEGAEYLDRSKNYIYVSNHASMFDIPAALTSIPGRVNIMFKEELTKVPLWGWALKFGPYIAIDRFKSRDAMQSIEEAAGKIRSGKSVLVFAEGTRTRDGKLQPFKRGAFAIAAKSGVPIVPVAINNTYRILPKGSLNVKPADITLVLDKPVETVGIQGREAEQELMERIHTVIASHYRDQ
ncbi:MAG: lysophospholipid acyltransferase family protein [Bacteroidota bacterium]